jgi:hypothetical protein
VHKTILILKSWCILLAERPLYRTAVTQRLKELDQQVRKAMCHLVSGRFVACTTDAWTSVASEAFVALTLHWLTEAFELVTISLDCSTFPGSHKGEVVAAKLNELLFSYGIPEDHVHIYINIYIYI